MSLINDHSGEPTGGRFGDLATEALLAGRAVPARDEPLAALVRALRGVTTQAVPPSAELATLMAAGAFPGGRPSLPPGRGLLDATVVDGLRYGMRALAAGLTGVLVAGSTAGFAGVLPAPVQDGFQMVVETVTRYQFPERTSSGAGLEGPSTRQTGPDASDSWRGHASEDRPDDHPGRHPRAGDRPPGPPAAANPAWAGPPAGAGPTYGAGPAGGGTPDGAAAPGGEGTQDSDGTSGSKDTRDRDGTSGGKGQPTGPGRSTGQPGQADR